MVELINFTFKISIICILFLACDRNNKSEKQSTVNEAAITSLNSANSLNNDKTVNCFIYHRFGDNRFPSTNIRIEQFKEHLDYLKTNGFKVMTMSKAIDFLKSSGNNEKVAVLTIDDGYESFYENGLPLLKEYGFPATLFINTETVGGADYMGWEEIKSANDAGIEIGNHTHSHAFFLNLPKEKRYDQFRSEIEKTQNIIEEHLGKKPQVFAYPYGEFDSEMRDIVKGFDFTAATAQNSGVIHSGSDLYALPRFPMAEAYAAIDRFAQKANMLPLRIKTENPESFILPDPSKAPELEITFDIDDLRTDQLQCFVQGGACELKKTESDSEMNLTIKAKSPLTARRTLYTITVPDEEGNWHWFSHLWINAEVADR